MPEGENDGTRHPFEVVGEATVLVGKPQPAFAREDAQYGGINQGHPDAVPASAAEDMREQLDTANRALSDARREIEHLRAEVQANMDERDHANRRAREIADERDQAHQALTDYRVQVRNKAIEVANDMDWCRPGLNEALRDLGLPEHDPRYRVPIRVTATQLTWVEVAADDEEDAVDEAKALSYDALELDGDSWEIQDVEKAEYSAVEEVQPEWH